MTGKLFRGLLTAALLWTAAGSFAQNDTQPAYEIVPDAEGRKVWRGFVTREQLAAEPDFVWYSFHQKYFKPQPEYLEIIRERAYDFHVLLFLGTWCEDSQQIIPKYFKTLDEAGFPENRITLVALDRQKTGPANLHRILNVVNVPTLIVWKDGKEIGRIEEFGASGQADRELAEIVSRWKP